MKDAISTWVIEGFLYWPRLSLFNYSSKINKSRCSLAQIEEYNDTAFCLYWGNKIFQSHAVHEMPHLYKIANRHVRHNPQYISISSTNSDGNIYEFVLDASIQACFWMHTVSPHMSMHLDDSLIRLQANKSNRTNRYSNIWDILTSKTSVFYIPQRYLNEKCVIRSYVAPATNSY